MRSITQLSDPSQSDGSQQLFCQIAFRRQILPTEGGLDFIRSLDTNWTIPIPSLIANQLQESGMANPTSTLCAVSSVVILLHGAKITNDLCDIGFCNPLTEILQVILKNMPSQEAVDVTILVRTINQIFDEPLPNPLPNPEDPSRLGEHTDPSKSFHFLLDSNHLDFKSDRRSTFVF